MGSGGTCGAGEGQGRGRHLPSHWSCHCSWPPCWGPSPRVAQCPTACIPRDLQASGTTRPVWGMEGVAVSVLGTLAPTCPSSCVPWPPAAVTPDRLPVRAAARPPTCPRYEGSALSTGVRCSLMPPASGGQQESKSEWGGGPLTVPRGDTSSLCSPSAGTGVLTDAHVWNACREPASCLQARQTAGLPPPRAGLNNLPSISEMTGLEMRDTRPFWVAPSLLPP